MRVFLGISDVAHQMGVTAQELNRLGHYCRFADTLKTYLKFNEDRYAGYALTQPYELGGYDIYEFYFAHADSPDLVLKDGGTIIWHICGSEARQLSVALKQNPHARVKVEDEERIVTSLKEMAALSPFCTIKDMELYDHVKPYFDHVYVTPRLVDLEVYKPVKAENKRPLIVHAPTSRYFKGTQPIVDAVMQMNEGEDFDFQLVHGIPHARAQEVYRKADVIIDQLHCGTFGMLTLEALAMGKVVICYVSNYMLNHLPKSLPIVNANPDNIKTIIEGVLDSQDQWKIIGEEGVKYVKQFHDSKKTAKRLLEVYDEIKCLHDRQKRDRQSAGVS